MRRDKLMEEALAAATSIARISATVAMAITPHAVQFDAYRNKLRHTWRPWGSGNLIQRLVIALAKHQFGKAPQQGAEGADHLSRMVGKDLARRQAP